MTKSRKTKKKSSSDSSEHDPYNLTYNRKKDPEGLHREYAKDYKKFRKENKEAREKFIAEAFAKAQEKDATEAAAEAEARAATDDAVAEATSSNRGAEIIAQYQIPKVPEQYEPPKDKSYKPLTPLVYEELPGDTAKALESEATADISVLEDDDMPTDDLFGEDQIATPKIPEKSLIDFKTPPASSSDEVLSEDEMMVDDLFGEDQVAEISALPVEKQTEKSLIIGLDEGMSQF